MLMGADILASGKTVEGMGGESNMMMTASLMKLFIETV